MVSPPTFVHCLLHAECELVQCLAGAAGRGLRSPLEVVTAGGAGILANLALPCFAPAPLMLAYHCGLSTRLPPQGSAPWHVLLRAADPVFGFLKAKQGGILTNDLKWNFTKFLVNREGEVVKRCAHTSSCVEAASALHVFSMRQSFPATVVLVSLESLERLLLAFLGTFCPSL